jgi:PAS domain S-box-containing protein
MPSKMTTSESVLDVVPDALVGVDQAGVVRFVNHPTESLFGYDRDDLVGQPIQTLVPHYLWEIYSDHRESYFADPRSRSMGLELELIGRQRDGTRFPVHIAVSVIDTGDVLLVITSAREMTKRKRAQEMSQQMAAIVEKSNDAIIGETIKGIVTSWNPAAEKMYGYSSEEIIGKFIHILNPSDRNGEVMSILAKVKADQPVEHFETTRVRKDGTRFQVSVSVAPIHENDGTVVGASVIGRDMTEQRKAFEVAQRMTSMAELSREAMVGGTLEGIITSWNPAAERMFGFSDDEIIGRSGRLLLPDDGMDQALPVLARIRAGQYVEHLETMGIHRDGTVFAVTLSVAPIRDAHGAIVGFFAIADDVTQQR